MANQGSQSVSITVNLTPGDTTPPTISISQPAPSNIVATTTPIIRGTASDNVGVTQVQVAVDSTTNYVNANGTSVWDYQTPVLSQGSHTIRARAFDAAGNVSTVASVTFVVDTVAPTITITSPANGSTITGPPGATTVNVNVVGTASDAGSGVQLVEVQVDGGAFSPATGTTSWSKSVTLGGGSHTITVRAVDGAVNTALMSISMQVGAEASNVDFLVLGGFVAVGLVVFTKEGKAFLRSIGLRL